MLRIRIQRESASDGEAVSVRTRDWQPVGGETAFVSGGTSVGREAASLHGAQGNGGLPAQEVPTAFLNRQVLV